MGGTSRSFVHVVVGKPPQSEFLEIDRRACLVVVALERLAKPNLARRGGAVVAPV